MKLPLALGVAFAALTVAAFADSENQIIIRHGGAHADLDFDANSDGWLSRDEASAGADRMFARMDTNSDGRLTSEDRPAMRRFEFRGEAPELEGDREVRIIRRGDVDEEEIERIIERAERDVERAERHAERAAEAAERHVERHVVIIRGDGDHVAPMAPVPPVPPVPPHPPMFMMLIANSEEADLNADGALSHEEFRAQHLRFFDASDANTDGRIRFEAPPAPPEAPTAPTPPEPPRRNR